MKLIRWLRLTTWCLTLAYWVAIFIATHTPPKPSPMHVSDKVAHFVAYALLSVGLFVSLSLTGMKPRRAALMVLSIAMTYAAVDELLQIPVGRSAEFGDWAADVGGAFSAVGICWAGRRLVATRQM